MCTEKTALLLCVCLHATGEWKIVLSQDTGSKDWGLHTVISHTQTCILKAFILNTHTSTACLEACKHCVHVHFSSSLLWVYYLLYEEKTKEYTWKTKWWTHWFPVKSWWTSLSKITRKTLREREITTHHYQSHWLFKQLDFSKEAKVALTKLHCEWLGRYGC